jgi:predicted nucleic acid-binding protein
VSFVDTNILLYAVAAHPNSENKTRRAVELLTSGTLAVSVQVFHEFYVQATRPSRTNRLSPEEALAVVRGLASRASIAALTPDLFFRAQASHLRFHISYWDAAIIEAALSLGCDTIFSEDLNHGQDYDGVRVENPFA